MSRDRSVYIRHIHDCISRIKTYTSGGEAEFFADAKTQDAVLRNLEVIGQAIKDYGVQELMAAHAEIRWEQIAGMRNILAHQYLGVDLALTWDVIVRHLPGLEAKIRAIAADASISLTNHGS